MTVLALDTATKLLSLALCSDDQFYASQIEAGLVHSERLLPMIDSLFSLAKLTPCQIDLIACMAGPGSFTGLRIGMATTKGLALALDRPFLAMPTLDCLAASRAFWPGRVLVTLDARKNRWFGALFQSGLRLSDDFEADIEEIAQLLNGSDQILLCGPDGLQTATALRPLVGQHRLVVDPDHRRGAAPALAYLAQQRFIREGQGDNENCGLRYLRQSDAELNLKQRTEL